MNLATLGADVLRRSFAPQTKLTGSQWANKHGWIARSSGAAEPGKYSTDRAPYLAEILDVMCDEEHRDVVFSKPAQCGFSELVNQFVGFTMAEDPSGLIVIQPSIEMAKAWVRERIDGMLSESPRLRGIVRSEAGRRTSDDTIQRKIFSNGWLVAVGANSPTGLRSRPARRVVGDERSGWVLDVKQAGDPWDLATERTTSFWNCKRVQGSTPGEEEVCAVTAALRASDWREYHVSCPSCGKCEAFQWKSEDGTYRLVCDRDPADQWIPQTARYLCTSCGVLIPESEKAGMLRGGSWVPRYPGRETVGFDLNGLASPWRSWSDVMTLWVKAQGNQEKLKVFVTHVLAQPWKPRAERVEVHTLRNRAEPMPELPAKIGALVSSVDVQKDRLETLVIGVGAGEETWCLEWEAHEGDPQQPETWEAAWKHLTLDRGVPMAAIAVDTGWLTDSCWNAVDTWSRRRVVRQVIGVKGEDGRGRPWVRKPGRATSRRARKPWIIGSDGAKDAIALRLLNPVPPGGPGAIHFADTLDEAFYDQLTAEELRVVVVKGRQQRVWRPVSKDRTNEALDLLVYSLGALYSLGRLFCDKLGEMAATRQPRDEQSTEHDSEPAPQPLPSRVRPRRPQFAGFPRRKGWAFRTD